MPSIQWWYVLLLAILAAVLFELVERYLKRRRFRGRTRLSNDRLTSLFATNGLTEKEIATFLDEVSRATTIPTGYLRPDDQLGRELAPVRGLSYDDGVFLLPEVLEYRFGLRKEELTCNPSESLRSLLVQIASNKEQVQRRA
jgi:hypothetical protein